MKKTIAVLVVLLVAAGSVSADWGDNGGGNDAAWSKDVTFIGDGLQNNGVTIVGGDVWIAGYDPGMGFAGMVYKKSGGTWSNMGLPMGGWLDGIAATSSSNVWVSGNGRVAKYDGTSWTNIAQSTEYTDIGTSGPLDAAWSFPSRVITSDGGVTQTNMPATTATQMRGVHMNSPTDIWFGGDDASFNHHAEHWDGTSFTTYSLIGAGSFCGDIAVGGGEVYTMGSGGVVARKVGGALVDIAQGWGLYARGGAVHEATGDLYIAMERGMIRQYDVSEGTWIDQLYVNLGGQEFKDIAIEGDTIYAIGTEQIGLWSTTIPEPATMSLLGLGALALIKRRRS